MATYARYRRLVRRPVRIGKTTISNTVTGSVVDLDDPRVRDDLRKYQHLVEQVSGLERGALASTPSVSNLGNLPLYMAKDNVTGGAAGVQNYVAIDLPKGATISGVKLISGSTALVGGTNQVASLYTSADGAAFTKVATSADATNTAWAANTERTFTFTTPYVTTGEGTHYVSWVVAAGTAPSYTGVNLGVATTTVAAISPVRLSATAGTGLTDTAASGSPTLTTLAGVPFVRVF